ncbi:hypothetical protein PsorP6_011896 [Peronosclerospora sorghi]|uniref:Uncharacterized protein n=1 Tax=Peronosclerospora sorghi TaxID=230839 RepID=A0ACC0WJE7_9STRA|nr:hypothetical protein PsorP6_011896 [Peronosclerospora sorghi]
MRRRSSGVAGKRVGEHHDGSFGVYMSHKIQKLRDQNEHVVAASSAVESSSPRGLFHGVHVYVDGYTVPSKEKIRQLMLLHGGGFEHYGTHRVTHIIATHLPAAKILQLKKARHPLPVVHPAWIVQSIEQKTLLPLHSFLYKGFVDPSQTHLVSLADKSATEREEDGEAGHETEDEVDTLMLEANEEVETLDDDDDDDAGIRDKTTTVRTNSTKDGADFVKHFFAKSRLHHIGTWRATFQQHAATFHALYKGEAVHRAPRTSTERVILHVDMDCFFVSVAVRGRRDLEDKSVAVAHSSQAGTSEISSCNYLARSKGVRAGMYMQRAKELCPELIVLPYDFQAIERVSLQIYTIFFSHTPYVQAVSCDEAFLEFGRGTDGLEQAKVIRQEILKQTGCPASVGVSFNLLLAKLSSNKAKPNGMYQLQDVEQAQNFILSLQLEDLPGVGHKTLAKLEALGVNSVRELISNTKERLEQALGKVSADMLFNFARGRDFRPLSMESNLMRKSVSAVVNFGIRFENWHDATVFLRALGHELSQRLQTLKVRTTCLTLLIKKRAKGEPVEPSKFMGHGICDNYSKSYVLTQATDDDEVIANTCIEMLRRFNFPCEELRGVGVQATKLVSQVSSGVQHSGQFFKGWLEHCEQQQREASASLPPAQDSSAMEKAAKREENVDKKSFAATTFSQINHDVLEELPEQLQREILASYGRTAASTALIPTWPLKRKSNGKAPVRRKHPARNIFDSKSNSRLAQAAHRSIRKAVENEDKALNDIHLSQVDPEVYDSLPISIRNEIDQYAKKNKRSLTTGPRFKSNEPSVASAKEAGKKRMATSVNLASVEDLFTTLFVKRVQGAGHKEKYHVPDIDSSVSVAFNAIYSRILIEIENRTLTQALRMLRFLRRKCTCTATSEAAAEWLKRGFNHVLALVNEEMQRQLNGVLSLQVIAPI